MASFTKIWSNGVSVADVTSLEEMISRLRDAADELQEMCDAGVVLIDSRTVAYDSLFLSTEDPAVAQEFGFEGDEDEEDEEQTERDEAVAGTETKFNQPLRDVNPLLPGLQEVPRELQEKLLSLGGTRVAPVQGGELNLAALLAQGKQFTLPVRLRPGERNRCHTNAAAMWGQDIDRFRLCTGYALARDCWRQHSWVVDEKYLYETTMKSEMYFGVELDRVEACRFWVANFLAMVYPGPFGLVNELGSAPPGPREGA